MCEFCGCGPTCGICGRGYPRQFIPPPARWDFWSEMLNGRIVFHRFTRNDFARVVYLAALAGFGLIVLAALVRTV